MSVPEEHLAGWDRTGILIALTVVFFGGLWTCWRRLAVLAQEPRSKPAAK
ncbi:MAG: hypothetical protein Q8M07_24830 [Prosthecobacter sp.]|nr:hypothetical protein [Prosthecobacter sp.]